MSSSDSETGDSFVPLNKFIKKKDYIGAFNFAVKHSENSVSESWDLFRDLIPVILKNHKKELNTLNRKIKLLEKMSKDR